MGHVELEPVVVALDQDDFAHLVQARAQADADAVFQRLFVGILWLIQVVRGEYGKLFVVVAVVDDLRHRVAYPVGRLRRPEFVQDQNLRVIDRLQNLQLGHLRNRVIAVLNLFEQIAEIIEKAWEAPVDQGFDRRNSKMGFAYTTRPEEKQTDINGRILSNENPRII